MLAITPRVDLILMDGSGSTSAVSFHLPIGTTVTAAVAAATALAAVVVPITGCVEVRRKIVYKMKPETPATAAFGSSIKRCGVFIFESDDGLSQELVQVPGILDSILVTVEPGAGILIDLSNSDVVAFIAALQDANDVNPFDVDCPNIVAAYRQSRV